MCVKLVIDKNYTEIHGQRNMEQRFVLNAVPRPYFIRPKVLIISENNKRTDFH